MTIVYLHNSFAYVGGIERIFINKMNYLADVYHYRVVAMTYQQCGRPIVFDISPNVETYDLDVPIDKEFQFPMLKRIKYYHKMRKQMTAKLSQFVKKNDVSVVIGATNEYFTMDTLFHLPQSVHTIIESHACKKFLVVQRFRNKNNPLMNLFYSLQDIRINQFIKKSDAFVSLTNGDAKDWGNTQNTYIIPNFIPIIPERKYDYITYKRIITLGRLDVQKGYDLLIDAWEIVSKKHADWHLDIYGDGDEKQNLMSQLEHLHLNTSISIHGFINDINEELQKSDLFVMSSRNEGFGLVLIEAMANGIPCVAFNCYHGPSDIIKDGDDGLLVEKGNIDALADKICYMIENENVRRKMGIKARENVKRYLPENIMPLWKQLFESLIEDK
jgi:glycosyltransferase involved in cell wall biosynthesis